MKLKSLILLALAIMIFTGGWALPSSSVKNVKANYDTTPEKAELVLTEAEVTVSQNGKLDPQDLIVSGTFDTLNYSMVDTSTPGPVTVTYIATKDLSTIKLTKTVLVKDGVAPEITGGDLIELKFNSEFDILSAFEASDNIDEEVALELVGEVDRLTAGEYTVVVKATDSSNNETTKEVTVLVHEDPEVVARNERNETYSNLVVRAGNVNASLLANTTVSEIENILNEVNNAKDQDSDHQGALSSLSSELTAKLQRARDFHAPAQVAQQPAAQAAPQAHAVVGNKVSYSANTYGAGWCTWWVADQRAAWGMPIPNNWGNAITWFGSAQAQGYATGYTPAVGAIAYFPGMNHVAFVEAVHGDGTITISEMGWNFAQWGFNRRVIPASSVAYIY